MRIAYVNYYWDEEMDSHEELLARYHSSVEWCKAVRRAGACRVSIVQRFREELLAYDDGIEFCFVRDALPAHLRPWHVAHQAHRVVASLQPDVVHLNGSILFFRALRRYLSPATALVWQYHGGTPPAFPKRLAHRREFRSVDAFFFTAYAQAEEWRKAGLLQPHQTVCEIMEASSYFSPSARRNARRTLAPDAEEVFLWVGRLNENKDPITVLRGFARILPLCTRPLLLMIYGDSALLSDVHETVASLHLRPYVRLIGWLPHDRLPAFYSAADYFLLGSHSEGSGFALLEAISCGVTPIVTDIPSFRTITDEGRIGALWTAGDAESFEAAFRNVREKNLTRRFIRRYFNTRLRYDVLGRKALSVYRQVVERRRAAL